MRLAALPVLALLLATAARAQTAETVTPVTNHPNSTTNVSGTGFGADEAVDIYFDTTDEQLAVTGSNGAFPATPVAVPASALPGTHYITAIGRRSGDAAQKAFAVRTNWPKFGEGNHNQGANLYENVLGPSTVSGLDLLWNVTTGSFIPDPRHPGISGHPKAAKFSAVKRKQFFFEKKNQKTFTHWVHGPIRIGSRMPMSKSFLFLFFKKEIPPSWPKGLPAGRSWLG